MFLAAGTVFGSRNDSNQDKPNHYLISAAKAYNVPPRLLYGIARAESNLNPEAINKHDKGSPSYGLCQLKLSTARFLGFKGKVADLKDPYINSFFAAKYLRYTYLMNHKSWERAISSFNAGHYTSKNKKYVKNVLKQAKRFDTLNSN